MEGARKVIYAALAGNLAVTGSSAMFSEGVHSVVDTGNQALLLHGMRRARRPPDERFPYGHGKEICADLPRDRTHDIIESLTRDIRRSDARVKRVFIGLQNGD